MIFSVANDTLNGAVDAYKLQVYAQSAGLPVVAVDVDADVLDVVTSVELTPQQATVLTGIVNTHDGVPLPIPVNHMAVSLCPHEIAIVNEDWPVTVEDQVGLIGTVTSRPDFFANIASLLGQVLGTKKVTAGLLGELPEIRIVQRNLSTGVETIPLGPVAISATTGFQVLNLLSSPGTLGSSYNEFFLQARRNGALEFRVRGVTCAVIELT